VRRKSSTSDFSLGCRWFVKKQALLFRKSQANEFCICVAADDVDQCEVKFLDPAPVNQAYFALEQHLNGDLRQLGELKLLESPRVLRRLQLLRRWSYEDVEQVLT
jgi:hypothetical protein